MLAQVKGVQQNSMTNALPPHGSFENHRRSVKGFTSGKLGSDEGAGALAPVKEVQQSSMPNALPPHGSLENYRRQAKKTCLSKMRQ